MSRKIIVRIIAMVFIGFGLWNIAAFFWFTFVASHDLNVAYILVSPFFLGVGYELLKFKNSGRKLAIVLLSIPAAVWIFLLVLATLGKQLGWWYIESNNATLQGVTEFSYTLAGWAGLAAIDLLAILFLLQKGTRELFVVKEKPSTQPE